ncbi:hypothetical protein C2845_PM01G21680 [Panicum miliaceum]|uniref:Ubiquitin-like protease family profile domain-containing protein n=1 Tax=Panicum miliaceum TaxID=4540 RepID=A0A3L6TH12_PANMI|nr:hypothetical protein C2845_PM01G21680 [Panicum miliaceum]
MDKAICHSSVAGGGSTQICSRLIFVLAVLLCVGSASSAGAFLFGMRWWVTSVNDCISSDDVTLKRALYIDCCRDFKKLKEMKMKLKKSLSHKPFPIVDPQASSVLVDEEFMAKIDSVSRCKVPKVITKYSEDDSSIPPKNSRDQPSVSNHTSCEGKKNSVDAHILGDKSPSSPVSSGVKFVFPPSGYPSNHLNKIFSSKRKSRLNSSSNGVAASDIHSLGTPLVDISNVDLTKNRSVMNSSSRDCSVADRRDVIMLDGEGFVPNSYSPYTRSSYPRFCSQKNSGGIDNCSPIFNTRVSPEVQYIGQTSLSQSVRELTKKSDAMYNKKFRDPAFISPSPVKADDVVRCGSQSGVATFTSFKARDSSTGGKVPVRGPRRVVKPGPLFRGDYDVEKYKFSVSDSDMKNYKAIVFWDLFNSATFCYNLFIKPNGHPDTSKSHYFFANIADNLFKEPDEANDDVLSRALKRSSHVRPLNQSDNLYFPTLFDDHWFLFVVDIKDKKFIFLDSLHHKDHDYQEFVRDKFITSFQLQWDRYVQVDMNFDEYEFLYPDVPDQPLDNTDDSGIYTMMFLGHWKSPRTLLCKIFNSSDISNIRVKIANCWGRVERTFLGTGIKSVTQ